MPNEAELNGRLGFNSIFYAWGVLDSPVQNSFLVLSKVWITQPNLLHFRRKGTHFGLSNMSIYSCCKPLTQKRWLLLLLVIAIKIRPVGTCIHSLGFRKVLGNPTYCMWHFFSFEFLIQLYSSEAVIPDNFCIFYSIIYISHSKKFVQVLGTDHKKCKKKSGWKLCYIFQWKGVFLPSGVYHASRIIWVISFFEPSLRGGPQQPVPWFT